MRTVEDSEITHMEDVIGRWKRTSGTARTCLVSVPVIALLLMLLASTNGGRLVLWIIALIACGALTVCDLTLQRYIAPGEKQLYNAQMDLIERKGKLAEIGALDFDANASRRLLMMDIPDGAVKIAFALYIIVDGFTLAMAIFMLVRWL